jgi:hypothetical protein
MNEDDCNSKFYTYYDFFRQKIILSIGIYVA